MNRLPIFILVLGAILAGNPLNGFARIDTTSVPAFTVNNHAGQWQLQRPDGTPFFSRGVCCVNPGMPWEKYSTSNPAYAAWQHFAEPQAWADATIDSLKAWGFTTIGGWSDITRLHLSRKMDLPFTVVLHAGARAGAPWWDMWDSTIIKNIDQVAREEILPVRDLPNLIGYYSDNELGWWNDALWQMTWDHKTTSGARQRLVNLLRQEYQNDWAALGRDFDPEGATDFASLEQGGRLYLRGGGQGIVAVKKFVHIIATRYYQLMQEIIYKYDPRHLILGDRYQAFYYPEVVQAAPPFVDVISTNFNAFWNDGTGLHYFLATLYELSQKPIMIGEFYLAAMENRSGNRNSSAHFPTVSTQAERARSFLTTLTNLAQKPYIIGADWFQFYDEPRHGRSDGENFNMGLIDIHGDPYSELVTASRNFHAARPTPAPEKRAGIPPAPAMLVSEVETQQILKNWDRVTGLIAPASPAPVADLYVCWSADGIFLGLCTDDFLAKRYYRDQQIPPEDRMKLSISLTPQTTSLEIRLGANQPPVCSHAEVKILHSAGVTHTVRHISVIQLPARLFGKKQFKANSEIEFSVQLQTLARAYTVKWPVRERLLGIH